MNHQAVSHVLKITIEPPRATHQWNERWPSRWCVSIPRRENFPARHKDKYIRIEAVFPSLLEATSTLSGFLIDLG